MARKVGLLRFQKEHWGRWLELADDRENWESSYEEWHRAAEAMAGRLLRAGLEVIWVDVDPEQFAHWCRQRGYLNDGESRSRYAAEQIGNIPGPLREQ